MQRLMVSWVRALLGGADLPLALSEAGVTCDLGALRPGLEYWMGLRAAGGDFNQKYDFITKGPRHMRSYVGTTQNEARSHAGSAPLTDPNPLMRGVNHYNDRGDEPEGSNEGFYDGHVEWIKGVTFINKPKMMGNLYF